MNFFALNLWKNKSRNFFQLKLPILFSLFLSGTILIEGQTIFSLESGKILDKIIVGADVNENYALYLPHSYSPEKKWAILYCFDPAGRGRIAVERFSEAAEKHGFIVVGSNNSQNGLDGEDLTKILNALWDDTQKRFNTDERRVYAAGFSGGARVASVFANSCNGCVAGIIGSGAGFSSNVVPSPKLPFIYFGAVGEDDYNYPEMSRLEKSLAENNLAHRIETFSGSHEWLPKELAETALGWMNLLAMKTGSLANDEKFIEEFFRRRAAGIEAKIGANQILEAFFGSRFTAQDFKGLRDVSRFENYVREIEKSKELKKAFQAETEQFRRQLNFVAELKTLGAKLSTSEEKPFVKQEIRRFIGNLKKTAEAQIDTAERKVARRTLNQAFAENFESAVFQHKPQKRFEAAIGNLEMATEIYPKSIGAWFELAQCYAMSGQKKAALKALEETVSRGFQNPKLLESTEEFSAIRQEERFQTILAKLKAANSEGGKRD